MTTETNRLRAALAQPENRPCTCHPDDNPPQPCAQRYALTECKALAQPETEAEPVAWAVMCDGSAVQTFLTETAANLIAENRREQNRGRDFDWQTAPLYAHPPRDEWRPASEPPEDGRDVVVWMRDGEHGVFAVGHCLRGEWTPNYVGSPVTHWRDIDGPLRRSGNRWRNDVGEIFRELQEESKERETRAAFERWLTEKRGTPLLLEQTQAYEAFKAGMKHYGCMTAVRMFQAEEAALAQPEAAEPVAWQRRYITPTGPSGWQDCAPEDVEHYRSRVGQVEVRPLYAHPPRDEWRPASEVPEDAMFSRGAVAAIVAGAIYDFAGFMTTRPVSVSIGASDACGPVVDLITSFAEKRDLDLEDAAVQSWHLCVGRDVQPPTEGSK